MSRLVFRNRTAYPDAEVQRLVRFAFADLELPSRFSVLVRVGYTRRGGACSGHAYGYVHAAKDVPAKAAWEVRLRLDRPGGYPSRPWREHGIEFAFADWQEALVMIAAHEGKHIEGYQTGHGGRSNRARLNLTGYQEEARCDAYAAWCLDLYRKSMNGGSP